MNRFCVLGFKKFWEQTLILAICIRCTYNGLRSDILTRFAFNNDSMFLTTRILEGMSRT